MDFKKMKELVLKDKELKGIEVSDADIFKVYQYIEMRDNKVTVDGYIPRLKTEPYIEIIYIPTKEKQASDLKAKLQRHLDYFDSDIYLQDVSLANFELFNDERKNAFDKANEFLNKYNKETFFPGLYLYGKYATGKTYLLSGIANELAKRDINVLFVFMPDLVRSIKAGMTEGDLEQRVNRLKQADVLMIDDFGGEYLSAWFRDEVLLPIIQYRLAASLPIFISSNLDYRQLTNALALSTNDQDRTKAVRIIQRIMDLTTYVKLSDENYNDK